MQYRPQPEDLTNKRFGYLLVIKQLGRNEKGDKIRWECLCDCGKVIQLYGSYLTARGKISCGCVENPKYEDRNKNVQRPDISEELEKQIIEYHTVKQVAPHITASELGIDRDIIINTLKYNNIKLKFKKDLIGKKFGMMTVIESSDFKNNYNNSKYYKCKCDCGTEKLVMSGSLTNSKYISCGCYKAELGRKIVSQNILKRGHSTAWKGAGDITGQYLSRVRDSARKRGIEFNIDINIMWNLFLQQDKKCALSGIDINFPSSTNLETTASLDRIDSSIGYIEGNIQWVHKDINIMKSDIGEAKFLNYCKLITEKNNKRGLLYKTRVYLGGNLENSTEDFEWRQKVEDEFNKIGITCLTPIKKCFIGYCEETYQDRERLKKERSEGNFDYINDYMGDIIGKDLRCVDLVDFFLFVLEPDKPTYGTTHEIVLASEQKKPIYVIVPNKNQMPLWLLGLIPPECVYDDLDNVIQIIKDIDSRKININKKYWKILIDEYRL